MNKKYCGVFINNTSDNIKLRVNINNLNNLKDNFNSIVVIDIDNNYSNELKDYINLEFDRNFMNIHLFQSLPYDKIDKWLYALISIKIKDYDYIVFIEDGYIYCDELPKYFKYLEEHNLDICSYNDSTLIKYHFDLYLFSVGNSMIDRFINYLLDIKNKKIDDNELYNITDNLESNNNIPFLKIGNISSNKNKNIFLTNDELYEYLMDNNELPIIYIDSIKFDLSELDNKIIYTELPPDFDYNIYRKSNQDLLTFSDIFLKNHFIEFGQFENRKYKKDNTLIILSNYIRNKLKMCKLLELFDFPDNFDIHNYKNLNPDLNHLTYKELIEHWFTFGINEKRLF
jgi:hypothetical protein